MVVQPLVIRMVILRIVVCGSADGRLLSASEAARAMLRTRSEGLLGSSAHKAL
jgi:hypothetical protein